MIVIRVSEWASEMAKYEAVPPAPHSGYWLWWRGRQRAMGQCTQCKAQVSDKVLCDRCDSLLKRSRKTEHILEMRRKQAIRYRRRKKEE